MAAAVRHDLETDAAAWACELTGLLEKYRGLLVLCRERDAFEAAGVFALARPEQRERHKRARTLARRFPGALRELDGATPDGLGRRIEMLEETLAGGATRSQSALWIRVVSDFHRMLGDLLAVKRAIAVGEVVSTEDRARVTAPPYGKLQELVWTELAQRYALAPDALRAIVHLGENTA